MSGFFDDVNVSIVLHRPPAAEPLGDAFAGCLDSAVGQDHPTTQVIVIDHDGPGQGSADLPTTIDVARGKFDGPAAAWNAGIRAARGDYCLLVDSELVGITLRRSCVRALLMAARRHPGAGVVYADYERVDPDGTGHDVHLLDWHEGRLRDATDYGSVRLVPTALLHKVGCFHEDLQAAFRYDLWLKITEIGPAVHVANRYAGSLYSVATAATEHNVFDYLLTSKAAQLEMEAVLTDHLKRTQAYLAPADHVQPAPVRSGATCAASIIIPVNNRPEFIGRAIESVQAQTVTDVEVIVVVNGGPDDPTAAAVAAYMPGGGKYNAAQPPVRLIVVDLNNLGVCFNTALQQANGQYYVQLDSDDRLKPDAVERLIAEFAKDPTIGMVIGSYEVWVLDEATGELHRDERVPVVTHDEWTADNGRNNLLRIGGAGAPRSARITCIADVGWFGVNDDPQCRNYGEDYDLVLRMSERYTIGRVWDPIYEVIRHSGGTDHAIDQVTIDRNDNAKDHMRLNALRRRRRLNQQAGGA